MIASNFYQGILKPYGGAAVGVGAFTEAGDILVGLGALPVVGSASITEAADSIAGVAPATTWSGYRLTVNSTYSGGNSISGLQIYTDAPGTNILTGGTASSSSGTASNAFDNNDTSQCVWAALPGWVQMRMGSAVLPRYMKAVYPSLNACPTDFKLEGTNDGVSFDILNTASAGQFIQVTSGGIFNNIVPVYGECWIMVINSVRNGGSRAHVDEMDLQTGGGRSVLSGGVPFASSCLSQAYPPSQAFNGYSGDAWENRYTENPAGSTCWLGYIQPNSADTSPTQIYLDCSNATFWAPSNFTIKKMAKGSRTWTTIGTYTWTVGSTTTITL